MKKSERILEFCNKIMPLVKEGHRNELEDIILSLERSESDEDRFVMDRLDEFISDPRKIGDVGSMIGVWNSLFKVKKRERIPLPDPKNPQPPNFRDLPPPLKIAALMKALSTGDHAEVRNGKCVLVDNETGEVKGEIQGLDVSLAQLKFDDKVYGPPHGTVVGVEVGERLVRDIVERSTDPLIVEHVEFEAEYVIPRDGEKKHIASRTRGASEIGQRDKMYCVKCEWEGAYGIKVEKCPDCGEDLLVTRGATETES